MEDRFKFRAWDKKKEEMIPILGICWGMDFDDDEEDFDSYIVGNITDYNTNSWHVDPDGYILMQCTGLKDKNGVLVYEGDILTDYRRFSITYLCDTAEGLGMNAGWYIQRDDFESYTELECHYDHEIIGNIHENPELLQD